MGEVRLFASGNNPFHWPGKTSLGSTTYHWLLPDGDTTVAYEFNAFTQLPGGTITASAAKLPMNEPATLAITTGTGQFAGATGVLTIGPDGKSVEIFKLASY